MLSATSANFVLQPMTPATHIQNTAPGPAMKMIAGATTIFAAPIDEARAVEAAWNGETVPSPPTLELNILPNVSFIIVGKYLNCTKRSWNMIQTPPPMSRSRIGHPQKKSVSATTFLITDCMNAESITIPPSVFIHGSVRRRSARRTHAGRRFPA